MARAGALAIALVALTPAAPALADPAVPTHYRSTVEQVRLPGAGPVDVPFEVEVLGGDAFLVLRAAPGTWVEVPGYDDEPYVRFLANGTVEVNERSPTRWLNDERYGIDAVPPIADPQAPPDWRVVAEGGVYAWHDHRIHFMSPRLPAGVDPAADIPQFVFDWEIPLVVDGSPVVVAGRLEWLPGPPPLLPGVLVAAGLAAAAWAARRWPPLPSAAAGTIVVGVVGGVSALGLPPGGDSDPALLALPVVAGLLASVGRQRRPLVTAAAGLPLLAWGVLQAGALTRPIVPGPLPAGAVRVAVVLAAAAGIAALGAGVRTWRSPASDDGGECG
jgi:hypothetical protein